MEPQQPPGSPPPAAPAAESGPKSSPLPATCPVCGDARDDDEDRFCSACGYDFTAGTGGPVPTSGVSKPVFWLLMVVWVAVALAGLIWLYNGLYRL